MTVQELTTAKVQERIQTGKLTIVDFYADWCGPCKQIAPLLDEIEKESAGEYEVYKIDVDKEESRDFLMDQMVMSIPTVVFFKDGKRVHVFVGLQDKKTIQETIAKFK